MLLSIIRFFVLTFYGREDFVKTENDYSIMLSSKIDCLHVSIHSHEWCTLISRGNFHLVQMQRLIWSITKNLHYMCIIVDYK